MKKLDSKDEKVGIPSRKNRRTNQKVATKKCANVGGAGKKIRNYLL